MITMRNRIKTPAKKVLSANAETLQYTDKRKSTDARIKELLNALNMDVKEYKEKSNFRMYSRMLNNKTLGI